MLQKSKFDDAEWKINVKDQYRYNEDPQGSPNWLRLRGKFLVTGNPAYVTTGQDEYLTPLQLSQQITGEYKRTIDAKTQHNFDRGHYYEDLIRDWFAKSYQRKLSCSGLISPLWNESLACSIDFFDDTPEPNGELGIGEIKTSYVLYPTLLLKMEGKPIIETTRNPYMPSNMIHIKPAHYWQMQFNMRLTNRKYCWYIVHATKQNKTYIEKVLFFSEFWDRVMYPTILAFIDYHHKRIANKTVLQKQ